MLSPHTPSRAQCVEVRRAGRFQLGLAARLQRQAAQAVRDEQDDFGGVVFVQFADEGVKVHDGSLPGATPEV